MISDAAELRKVMLRAGIGAVYCNVWLDVHSKGKRQIVGDPHLTREHAIAAAAMQNPASYRVTHRLRIRFKRGTRI